MSPPAQSLDPTPKKVPAPWAATLARPVEGLNAERILFPGIEAGRGDYVSYAIYYWPDPKTEDGFPYIPRDGQKNPELMAKGDALRLSVFLEIVRQLAHAWEQTQDSVYSQRAGQWMRRWLLNPETRMNPHLTYSQIRPGKTTVGQGGGIIDMANLPLLLDALETLRTSDALTLEDWAGVDAWMQDYLTWLMNSTQGDYERHSTNNHYIYYMGQCARLAEFLGDEDTARALLDEAFERLDDYIAPDGGQPMEIKRVKGFDYSIYGLNAWQRLATIGNRLGRNYWSFESPSGASLDKAYYYLEQFTGTTGKPWPQTGKPFPAEAIRSLVKPKGPAP